ncbi:AAA family ATPase [Cryobacterium sp. SO2]|uniref:AAA family ATPase n=1 Tax=Cryobacterium sp. SO2 TaxID=1897060 RepID=UPI00223DF451|nr:AAA family ATPase [Cryobacterium sp. SO2]WEO76088.1 AAA family ATPase [Cryobacterium sp. SO2]
MRLVKAEITGFGRLADGKVNLDNKVIAIVGPNEAGKTTLLRALAYTDNGATLSASERSRGLVIEDSDVVVRVQYLLNAGDRTSAEQYGLQEPPTSIWLSRTAAGGTDPSVTVVPSPLKAFAPLEAAVLALRATATKKSYAELQYRPPVPDEGGDSVLVDEHRISLQQHTRDTISMFLEAFETGDGRLAVTVHDSDLRQVRDRLNQYSLGVGMADALSAVLTWVEREDPTRAVAATLFGRTPNILLFSDADRILASAHALSEEFVAAPPASLANLLGMAELDLKSLWAALQSGDEGERETLIDVANQVLAAKFAAAWKQSAVTVWLKIEGTVLTIRIRQDGKRITKFDERSAGLQMFVALVAFLAVRDETIPPILLIDEAETHLHIDAQADLVNTFMTQQQAAKIVYTTHSPACLPPDLGSNIRAVVPDAGSEYRSVIQGSFWHGAAGYSPLMLAMGAGAAAFSAARFVVLAEGATEMLLLPSLIKSAINVADLEYQVAPGLSEARTIMYPELDLVGARVAFLVDGDKGGQDLRRALVGGGVPGARIVTLDALTLENLLDSDSYLEAVRALLAECNPGKAVPDLPELPDPASEVWPSFLDRWATQQSLKMPGKRVIASRLVEDRLATPSDFGRRVLTELHRSISTILSTSKTGNNA